MKHANFVVMLLCLALTALACTPEESPAPTELLSAVTAVPATPTVLMLSTPTLAEEKPISSSTPPVETPLPTQLPPDTTTLPTLPPLPQAASGNAEVNWVVSVLTDTQNIPTTEIILPGFQLNLPGNFGGQVQVTSQLFESETRTPPMVIAQIANYPWGKSSSTLYVIPVEATLYSLPEMKSDLEQVRNAINTLIQAPEANVTLVNVVPGLSINETYFAQAGTLNGGIGVHAIAMLKRTDENLKHRPYYVFWGFSSDMQYLIFAAFGNLLTLNQPAQMTVEDFQSRIALHDQILGFRTYVSLASGDDEIVSCPGAPVSRLKITDWARVSVDPPLANRIRSSPSKSGDLVGEVQPGENVLILDGPQCADGYAWWQVRSLSGLEGWTAEGDAAGYWLVEPISAWYDLPEPIQPGETKAYDLREIRISLDTSLFSAVEGTYYPLATPLPTPATAETPWPDDPRRVEFGDMDLYAAHSDYSFSGAIEGDMRVYDLQDPLSRYYLGNLGNDVCVPAVRKNLEKDSIYAGDLDPFCGTISGIPLLFKVDIQVIPFSGGKGLRFLTASGNYLTVDSLTYIFQGLSEDGRYYITLHYNDISHPYMVGNAIFDKNMGPLLAWRSGQYEEAGRSYQVFNDRIGKLLEARVVPLYPSLELLDAMAASIEIK
jgi:hypothetical protein